MALDIVSLIFGIASLVLAMITIVPQLIQLWQTKNTSGISLLTYIIFVTTSVVWVVWSYGFYLHEMSYVTPGYYDSHLRWLHQLNLIPAVIMNDANLILMAIVLAIKVKHVVLAKKLHITELELANVLLKKQFGPSMKPKGNFFKKNWFLIVVFASTIAILAILTVLIVHFTPTYTETEDIPTWTWVLVVNVLGAISWEAVSWPQVVKSIREKDTTGVSLGWAIFLPASCVIMVVYDLTMGLAGGDFSFEIIGSLVLNGIISSSIVLSLKIKNMKAAKAHHMSEVEYTKKFLIPLVAKQKAAKAKQKRA